MDGAQQVCGISQFHHISVAERETSTTSQEERIIVSIVAALVSIAALAGCQPHGKRYVDLVFARADKWTIVYAVEPNLTNGQPEKVAADVYQPAGDRLSRRPAVIWIHGGGFRRGDRTGMDDVAEAYARRGYVTMSIDYRVDPQANCRQETHGATEPSSSTNDRSRCGRAAQAAQVDALQSIRWLRAHAAQLRVDGKRIAVGGASAGAVTAVNVAGRANPDGGRVRADVKVGAALAMSGCQFNVSTIDRFDAPLSLLASGHDPLVPYQCVTATANAASKVGTPVQRIFYPSESLHVKSLYKEHQATVDSQWTSFLIKELHL